MLDPRDPVNSDDALTESSDDELLDLQKEYELKKAQLLEKKTKKDPTFSSKPLKSPANPPKDGSSFIQGLYQSKQTKKISYEDRLFELDVPEPEALEVKDDKELLTREYLRIRNYPNEVISKTLKNIKVLNVNKLLAKVVKPAYLEPNYDNWALVGYIVNKSEPMVSKNKDKYITIKVGTFDKTVSVTLFKDAFTKYWKLRLGEIIVILNPTISRYDKGFGLNLNDEYDTIMSIGIMRDLGTCAEPECKTHIHSSLKYCEFHQVKHEKQMLKNPRMELNGSVKLFNPKEKQINEETQSFYQKSAFDGRKYFKSNILDNEGKKRKHKDDVSNRNLEKKLIKLGNASKYKTLGLVKAAPVETEQSKKTIEKKTESINELRNISKAKIINLGMSVKDKRIKKQKWEKNMTLLKKDNNEITKKTPSSIDLPSSDDSDIEIEFSSVQQKKAYSSFSSK